MAVRRSMHANVVQRRVTGCFLAHPIISRINEDCTIEWLVGLLNLFLLCLIISLFN